MMTRTCALELRASSAILMNSVDTGWINDENPLEKAAATAERNHFQARGWVRVSPIPNNSPNSNPHPHPALTLTLSATTSRRLSTRSTPRPASSTPSCRSSTAASTCTVSS